jgi:hypothetical protein
VRVRSSGFLMTLKCKQWRQSADRGRENRYLKNCRPAKAPMIGGNFPKAFSRGRSRLDEISPNNQNCQRSSQRQVPHGMAEAFRRLSGLQVYAKVWWFAAAQIDHLRRYRDKTTLRVRADC